MFAADNVPFVAAGYDNAWKFYQAQKPILREEARGPRPGAAVLGAPGRARACTPRTPLKSVDDFKGTKFRTYSPLHRAPRRAAGREPDGDPGARGAAGVRHRHDQRDDHLLGHRHLDQGLGVRQELLHDQRDAPEERGGGERPRVPAADRRRSSKARAPTRRPPPRSAAGTCPGSARQTANKMLADNGMTVHAPDAALMAALNKVGDTIAAEWLKAAGADGEAIVKAYRGSKRGALRRFLDRLYAASGALAAVCLAGICVLMLAQAVGREVGRADPRRRRHRRLAVRGERVPRARPHVPPRRTGARRAAARPPAPRARAAAPRSLRSRRRAAVRRLHALGRDALRLRELEIRRSRAGPDQDPDLDSADRASCSAR